MKTDALNRIAAALESIAQSVAKLANPPMRNGCILPAEVTWVDTSEMERSRTQSKMYRNVVTGDHPSETHRKPSW